MEWFRGHKPVGTIIQRREGKNYVKTERGWIIESRLVAEKKLLRRKLEDNEKVYHKDCTLIGTKEYNEEDNLVVLKFNATRYRLLPHPNIVYLPPPK
jgi:hypothetical protein